MVMCFAFRIIIAVGTALANTASLAVLTEKFNAHLSAVFVSNHKYSFSVMCFVSFFTHVT